ncbi:substrate-binding periplasmic protein [Roseateles sp. BYS78W]|uniref:Substrate-binding periplasmic protein n=1 Tax=Pelomonas candidula TaxID=3299025 RepID=A0ABW7HHE3_9BURK
MAGLLVAGAWLAAVQAAPAEKPVLRFIVGEDWAPPYLELRGGRPVGGLAFELMEQVARAADARPVYVMLPPKRTQPALHAGQADLMCMMAPKWVVEPLGSDRVGPPMVVLEDVLAVGRGGLTRPLDLAAQRGLRVGTVLGYHYQELGPLFDAGQLVRDDAVTQQGVLEKLARGRTPAAVVDRLVLAQYNRGHPPAEALRPLQVVSQTVTHCLLGGTTQLPAARLQQALRAVVERGDVARLVQRYR